MALPSYPVSSIRTVLLQSGNQEPLLCPWLPSLPDSKLSLTKSSACQAEFYLRWSYVCKPLTSEGPVVLTCSDPLGEGLAEQPRNIRATVLLQMPRDCSLVPTCHRKSSCNHVAAVFQGLW